jgi:hypothetical protein
MIKFVKKAVVFSSLLLFSVVSLADYKINISSQSLNQNSRIVEFVPPGPVLVPFDETGDFGNIAMIGTNGIAMSSVTTDTRPWSSSFNNGGLFDGYQSGIKINSQATSRYRSGNYHTRPGYGTDNYFSIDLGRDASISGFRILSHTENNTENNARDIRIKSSVDGTHGSFTTEESFTLPQVADTGVVSMATPFTSRYFRFYVVDSYNLGYLAFGEIEVFQTQP